MQGDHEDPDFERLARAQTNLGRWGLHVGSPTVGLKDVVLR